MSQMDSETKPSLGSDWRQNCLLSFISLDETTLHFRYEGTGTPLYSGTFLYGVLLGIRTGSCTLNVILKTKSTEKGFHRSQPVIRSGETLDKTRRDT